MDDLSGRVALVTGSSRGIGRAIALALARAGAEIVINFRRRADHARSLQLEIRQMGRRCVAIQADVSKVADIERLFAATVEHFGRLDIVVANAGVELVDLPVVEVSEADFDRVFGVNTKGAFFTLQNAARHVADNGRIIYIGSSNTAYPLPGYGLYGGSKIAPQFLVQVLGKELGARGIAVNAILPTAIGGAGIFTGEVKPEFLAFIRSFRPMQRMGTVDDVANAAEYLASDLAGFVSGQHLLVTGGAPA